MKFKTVLIYCLYLILAAMAFAAMVIIAGLFVRPNLTNQRPSYTTEQLNAAQNLRDIQLDPNNPPVLYQYVDYTQAPNAPWFPKGQSPILDPLVQQKKIPPVHQRLGPEPAVLHGVDGIGKYGGTWYRLTTESTLPDVVVSRLSYTTLVRWSPQGYPIVPHVAKAFTVSPDNRQFTFHLRRGMKWSDGHPFTADDIIFWWKHIANDKTILSSVPDIMMVQGQPGNIEKVDNHTIRVTFPQSNGIFLAKLASDGMTGKGPANANMLSYPAHYLQKFHPVIGDKELIKNTCHARRMQSPAQLFRHILQDAQQFPDYPRLWPWIYRKYNTNPPHVLVRNPYYWMVDTQGNQLPYIDRVVFEQKSPDMIPIAAANGQVSMQFRHIPYEEYTHLMSQRQQGGYELYHWYPGDRSKFLIACNLNFRVDPAQPETAKKHALLNQSRFRHALSLAINRPAIIQAEYNGQAQPAQCAPGPSSYFYQPTLYHSFTQYDPDRAHQLLDQLNLHRRDRQGFRTFPDGSRMTFYLNVALSWGSPGIMQMIVDDWAQLDLRVIPRLRNRGLFYIERMGLQHDLNVWMGNSEFLPIVSPRYFLPRTGACNFAIGYARWYAKGGLYNDPRAQAPGCIAPPLDHPCRKVMTLYDQLCQYSDPAQQKNIFNQIQKINAQNLWTINVSTPPPVLVLVKNGLRNVPRRAVACWEFKSPGNAGIETYYFEKSHEHQSVLDELQDSMLHVRMPPTHTQLNTANTHPPSTPQSPSPSPLAQLISRLIKTLIWTIPILLLALAAFKHPYIARRLLIMIPTLLFISVVIFIIIQAPPGDFLTSRIMMLEEQGDSAQLQEIDDLRKMFWLDKPLHVQYARWLGLYWFKSFDPHDQGLLQGNLGRSMAGAQPVNEKVGDRILLTFLISLGSILFTWSLAIPIGIYSAVRQYSLADYLFSFLAFIGMCIPSFLLALLCMYLAKRYLGLNVSGLFSSQYGAQPQWDWPKFIDLIKHIWLPIIVLGVGGTAGMVRVMRGNLLDELKKPYVLTARAKGVRPTKLLFKYPVRLALNPFISGIGALFPKLVSGGAIVAMVLSLPTVGPLMLDALMLEDMYLAGSMLMTLSLLGVMGTLISDLLLLWLDPRIRFQGSSR